MLLLTAADGQRTIAADEREVHGWLVGRERVA
jgi:hypothetical protein